MHSAAEQRMWWLHIPKAGTSFGLTLGAYPRSSSRTTLYHQLLPRSVSAPGDIGETVAMFREPTDRLRSTYEWVKARAWPHKSMCCREDWGWPRAVYVRVHQRIKANEPAETVLAPFVGCQTNMLIGRGCMSQHRPSPAEVSAAIARISSMRFVGLTSEWRLSICLFNVLTTGRRFVLPGQLLNTRPSPATGNGTGGGGGHDVLDDLTDGLLYQYAAYRFWAQVASFGLSEASCPELRACEMPPLRIDSIAQQHLHAYAPASTHA